MNKTDSVQRAYRWAFELYGNKKSKMLVLFCARQILSAIEDSQDDNDVAYGALIDLVREWLSRHKDGLERPIKTLAAILDVDVDELAEAT